MPNTIERRRKVRHLRDLSQITGDARREKIYQALASHYEDLAPEPKSDAKFGRIADLS